MAVGCGRGVLEDRFARTLKLSASMRPPHHTRHVAGDEFSIPNFCPQRTQEYGSILPVPHGPEASIYAVESGNSLVEVSFSNQSLRNVFQDEGGPMRWMDRALLYIVVLAFAAVVFVLFSGVAGVGYVTYDVLLRINFVCFYLLGGGLLGTFVLHATSWYTWPANRKLCSASVVLAALLAGMVCYAKWQPEIPLIVCCSQLPAILGVVRFYTKKRTSSKQFYKNAAVCLCFAALSTLVAWICWIYFAEMPWGESTKAKLRTHMTEIFQHYELTAWRQCQQERAVKHGADHSVLERCARIELLVLMIWITPMSEVVVLLTLGIFCMCRFCMLESGSSISEAAIRLIIFAVCVFGTAFWVVCSTKGASMELSSVMYTSVGCACFCFFVWLLFAVDFEQVMEKAKGSGIYKATLPALRSDYMWASMWCFSVIVLSVFLVLEFITRQLERLVGVVGSGDPYLTRRGRAVAQFVSGKHWASVLEKSFVVCVAYLVFFIFTRFATVFLSWLSDVLQTMTFLTVCCIFYVVGLVMFLLPPVPGVPVYVAAGCIVVARGKEESWLDFYGGVVFTSFFGLVLKLNAVTMQQKIIGEWFGRSIHIQRCVGVHTVGIRAVEQILAKPGLRLEKVAILCGGPDWPTSVLTGILRMNLTEMLLGTLPCFFLIIPCVLGGASLNEESLQSLSPMIIMLVGVSQGGVMLLALVYIAKEVEMNNEQLVQPRPQHEKLVTLAALSTKEQARYKQCTEWSKLSVAQRVFLAMSVFLELVACWVWFSCGSRCFRTLNLNSKISQPYNLGGLNGSVVNVVKPLGLITFVLALFGGLLFFFYSCLTSRKNRIHAQDETPSTTVADSASSPG
eukprot:TRINITY_DN56492_c0_g1_i1.p1 TRINITY_DN56492_c0_g1~~TRINITY_DN56492_c0_g1_i1.p1  ORF type:complete len:857 (-),score=91.00 TRINITY_DN56492_c0_g1_i1:174-2723(-)